MTQTEKLLLLFQQHGNLLRLGQIPVEIGYEWRARATELRRKGYQINLIKKNRDTPAENLYELIEPPKFEQDGQQVFA